MDWQVSSFFGWGVYGLNLALEWSKDRTIEFATSWPMSADDVQIDTLRKRALRPFVQRSALVAGGSVLDGVQRLKTLGNDLRGLSEPEDGDIGVVFFEQPLSKEVAERAKRYRMIVAGSSWNEGLLRAAGVGNVTTVLQGVDTTLFHPAPKRGLFPGRFLIFSGGKAEPRKGQDLVVKAFRIFAKRHPEAMLVTAWRSPWPHLAKGMDLDLSAFADRVIDVGATPNALMPQVLRECDVALFPNRAEGGTNLVAMECLRCHLPTILSANTGHLDLVARGAPHVLRRQSQSEIWPNGGESDIDEILHALELQFTGKGSCYASANLLNLTWAATAAALKTTLEDVHG